MSTLFISPARSRQVIAAIVAFALVSVFVIRTSDAAFTAETTNEGNTWSTGEISLTSDTSTALFGDAPDSAVVNAIELVPGDVVEGCVLITYAGTAGSDNLTEVELAVSPYASNVEGLASSLAIETAREPDCTDPSYSSAGTLVSFTNGSTGTGWTPSTSGETQGFHFRVTVDSEAPMNGEVSGVDLTWSVSTTS